MSFICGYIQALISTISEIARVLELVFASCGLPGSLSGQNKRTPNLTQEQHIFA